MKRLRISVYGRVQRVGYRDAVAEIARKLKILGTVRNLEDEVSVEIIVEGEEKQFDEFLKQINIKEQTIDVENIVVYEEKATGKFKYFKIIRGEPNEELGERIDVAGKYLYSIKNTQESMKKTMENIERTQGGMEKTQKRMERTQESMKKTMENIERTQGGMEKTQKRMERTQESMKNLQIKTIEKLDEFHKDTTDRFDVMESKYGKVSESLEMISKDLHKLVEILAVFKPHDIKSK
ncbi:MAG: acylphosphatase [Candidatus Micrarchaeota archaeon]